MAVVGPQRAAVVGVRVGVRGRLREVGGFGALVADRGACCGSCCGSSSGGGGDQACALAVVVVQVRVGREGAALDKRLHGAGRGGIVRAAA